MKRFAQEFVALLSLGIFLQTGALFSQNAKLGLFEQHGDIGVVAKPGAVEYDAAQKNYLIRQSLDPDSPYADAALHGNGLTSIQYREEKGGPTREIQANVAAPHRIRERGRLCFHVDGARE